MWHRMLEIHAEQQFVIGVVTACRSRWWRATSSSTAQEGFYNWDPGAFFGIYRPDTSGSRTRCFATRCIGC
jgi:peptide/nickel transport system substrate-binding protein